MLPLLTALLLFTASPDIGTPKNGVIHLTAEEAAEVLKANPDITVLDVRTRGEYRAGHIEGATQINYFAPGFRERLEKLEKSNAYLVHCKTGGRSSRAVRILKDLGPETIYHLDGGIVAWRKAGLPTVTESKEATE
ncbi:rhodanese-like domain-containing protein [Parvularcula sp. ZS-1/3]|uniref:Rhodanese-like domain-containing protein n=1 Tax=Parvularcula mediterranea TaxID=2732508 RepID=A0A7Y3RNB5_9PROT|nr:rhodanese-like domain-containing protein [Parvularcula mediterranea]NNU17236.1 rhodanese-like domain-containing protein [Parvularcula mediterranea]